MRKYDGKNSVECTAEEQALQEEILAEDKVFFDAEKAKAQAQEDLKASAKAKLVAGEPLTEAEADILVI